MNSLTILHLLLEDASVSTGANVTRDFITIKSRLEHEGDSFLTITLPTFGTEFLLSLDAGKISSSSFTAFRRKTKGGKRMAVPCFLHGLVTRVFDEATGNIREDADVISINFVWKLCCLYKKQKLSCTPERIQNAYASYIEADLSLRKRRTPDDPHFHYVARRVVSELGRRYGDNSNSPISVSFAANDSSGVCVAGYGSGANSAHEQLPRHGPGSTADGLLRNQKYTGRLWNSRWNNSFSWEDLYGFSTIHQASLSPSTLPRDELPVKVISVPKTMKAPRIISIEPTHVQYAQQYVSSRLVRAMSESSFSGQINIRNQKTNADLALLGSKNREWATLDLSEASDRVSLRLVRDMFKTAPQIAKHLFSTRSRVAQFADGTQLILAKFASMGSASTFPVETIVFYVIAVAAVAKWRWDTICSGKPDPSGLGRKDLYSVYETSLSLAFTYGDDIIVPTGSFRSVVCSLEDFNLKVNHKKSFSQGAFRESCGTDAYNGTIITPLYIRTPPPTTRDDAKELISWVSFANSAYRQGLWKLARGVRGWMDKKFGPFPHTLETSPGLGWYSYLGSYSIDCWSKDLQSPRVRALVACPIRTADAISEYDALLKFQITSEQEDGESTDVTKFTSGNADHLEQSVLRDKYALRPRKVSPF